MAVALLAESTNNQLLLKCTIIGTLLYMTVPNKTITARFYRLSSSREPVREWLRGLSIEDRKIIGSDIMEVEFEWPVSPPLVKALSGSPGLKEVRSTISDGRIARVFFYIDGSDMVLLHGFVKKSQKTPDKELQLAKKRKKEHENNA